MCDRWFKPLPLDLTAQLVKERRIFFHTAIDYDPWWCIGPKSVHLPNAFSECSTMLMHFSAALLHTVILL